VKYQKQLQLAATQQHYEMLSHQAKRERYQTAKAFQEQKLILQKQDVRAVLLSARDVHWRMM
jgi:hypothetical protein